MIIRDANERDWDDIDQVYVAAFPVGEGIVVSKIALDLLSENPTPKVISLVAEIDGNVVGHVAFSPVGIDHNPECSAYILTPLAVQPKFQKQHVGSALVEYGLKALREREVNLVFVYGDPKYYGRFGFQADIAAPFIVPYKLQYPFGWLGINLIDGGVCYTPAKIRCGPTLSDPTIW